MRVPASRSRGGSILHAPSTLARRCGDSIGVRVSAVRSQLESLGSAGTFDLPAACSPSGGRGRGVHGTRQPVSVATTGARCQLCNAARGVEGRLRGWRTIAETFASCAKRIERGIAWGSEVAQAVLAWRATDGFNLSYPPFTGGTAVGQWRPTPPAFGPRGGCHSSRRPRIRITPRAIRASMVRVRPCSSANSDDIRRLR